MKTYKVHMLGPVTGSGWNRTLCEKFVATGPIADCVEVSADPDQVTCGHCRRRLDNTVSTDAREEDDAYQPN